MRLNQKTSVEKMMKKGGSPPSEEDKLWPFIKETYDLGLELRQPFERHWLINLAFLSGKQYSFYNNSAQMLQSVIGRPGRVRIIHNMLLPRYRKQVSRLIRNRPTMSVVPNTTEQEDIDAAKVGDKVLKSFWRTNKMQKKIRQLGGWIYGCGNGFLDDRWNPKKGPTKLDNKGNLVYQGDVDCGVWSPFDIGVPVTGLGDVDIHDLPWMWKAKYRPLEWIQKNYKRGKDVPAEERQASKVDTSIVLGVGQSAATSKVPGANVIELYIQPNGEHKNGLFVTGANGIVLQKANFPFDHFNIEQFKDVEVPGVFWGMATLEAGIWLQKLWNRTLSDVAEFNRVMGRGKWMSPRGCNMQEVPDDQIGQIIEYTARMGMKPEHVTIKNLPTSYQQVLSILMQGFMDLFSQHEVSSGTNKSDIRSGEMVQLLLEQDDFGNVPTHAVFEESMEGVMSRVLERIQKGYTSERAIQVTGRDGEFEVESFKGADLKGNTAVHVKKESSLPDSRVGRQAAVMARFEKGLYGNPDDPNTRRQVRNLLDDVPEGSNDETRFDETNAKIENQVMLEGKGHLIINQYDGHAIHIIEHNKFRKQKIYQDLKRKAVEDKKAKRYFMLVETITTFHVQQHQKMIDQARAQQMAEMARAKGGASG